MTEFSIVHEFEGDPQTFWRVFLDSEYQTEMYRSVGISRSEVSRDDQGDRLVVVARCMQERQPPAVVRSLLGGRQLGYVETLTFYKKGGLVEQLIEPTVMGDRFRFGGTVTVEKLDDKRLRRTYAGSIKIDLPLVGKKVEQSTVGEMRRTNDQAAQVTRAWLAKALTA